MAGRTAAEVRQAAAAWHALWARPDIPSAAEAHLFALLSDLPPFPAPAPLTFEQVARAARALPIGRAPGADDWPGDELRRWPDELLLALASLLHAVEGCGRWPADLRAAEVVLLPKPGGDPDEALQRRSSTLLPVAYRLWVRLRLPHVELWRSAWDPATADAPKGADGQAWDLAWDLATAPASGQSIPGAAADLSKCYDGVRHALPSRALAAAGWPAALAGPPP